MIASSLLEIILVRSLIHNIENFVVPMIRKIHRFGHWYQTLFADVSNSDRFDLLQFKQHIDQLLLGLDLFCPAPVSSDHAKYNILKGKE